MLDTLTVFGIGFSVVFIGLLCLIGIIYLMSFLVSLAKHEYRRKKSFSEEEVLPEHNTNVPSSFTPKYVSALERGDRRSIVAAVSAAIAEYLGTDVSGLRIHSIKQVGHAPSNISRRELIAVISASIASEMGTDVSAIRIHSIKKVS